MKMFSFEAENIYDVVRPVHLSSQLMGLTAFSIRREKGIFVESVTWFNLLCIALSVLNISSFSLWFISQVESVWQANNISISEVFQSSLFCVQLSFMFVENLAILSFFSSRKKFCLLLNLIMEVDKELEEMKVPMNFRKQKIVVSFFILFHKALTTIAIFLGYILGDGLNVFKSNFLVWLSMFFFIETTAYLISHFTFWMWAVKLRYEKINLFLKKNFLTTMSCDKEGSKGSCYNEDGNEKLNTAAWIHDKLVDVSECINRCYGSVVRNKI